MSSTLLINIIEELSILLLLLHLFKNMESILAGMSFKLLLGKLEQGIQLYLVIKNLWELFHLSNLSTFPPTERKVTFKEPWTILLNKWNSLI